MIFFQKMEDVVGKLNSDDKWIESVGDKATDSGRMCKEVAFEVDEDKIVKLLRSKNLEHLWVRLHAKARRTKFTPMKVSRGP